mgnify:CR=1 FL=1
MVPVYGTPTQKAALDALMRDDVYRHALKNAFIPILTMLGLIFGVVAMLAYPFIGHWFFSGDAFKAGLFLGTSVHETAQVAGAGLVYQQYYNDPQALDVATVTKLVRNLGMLLVIPLMSVLYHRNHSDGTEAPKWYTMVPLFVIGFALMSLIRTVGDMGDLFDVEAPDVGAPRKGMSTVQACELGLAAEKKAHDFYDKALPGITNPEVRELFAELRDEETEHVEMLREAMAKLPESASVETENDPDDAPFL